MKVNLKVRKLLPMTLAAGLVLSTAAVVPFSTKGNTAYAATLTGTNETQLLATALNVYSKLGQISVNGSKGTDLLHQARLDAENLITAAVMKDGLPNGPSTVALANQLIPEIWTDITNKYGPNVSANFPTLQADLVTMIFHLSFVDSTDPVGEMQQYRTNLHSTFAELASLTGDTVPTGEDIATFAAALQSRIMMNSLSSVSSYSSTTIQNNLTAVTADVKYVQDTLATPDANGSVNATAKVLKDADIEPQSIVAALQHFEKAIPSLVPARDALVQAYYAAEHPVNPNPGGIGTVVTGGGFGGAGGTTIAPVITGPDNGKAQQVLDQVKNKLDDLLKANNGNTQDGVQNARQAIEQAIQQIATVDLSQAVQVTGDVAKPSLDATQLNDIFKSVKALADQANSQLKAAAADAEPAQVVATLDLGNVTTKTVEIPLSKDILDEAAANGIDAIALKVGGVSLTVAVDQLKTDTTVTVQKQDQSVATSATNLPVVAPVYEFNFATADGSKITNFTKPVEVRIPVTSTNGVDTELLSLAKIYNGKLIFFGGKYDKDTGALDAVRNSFSTYTVVENKVSFADTASVNDWAGRQIQVVAAKGIIDGRAEGQFVPNDKVTRAEFAKMVVTAFGLQDPTATDSFTDVNNSDWFQPYVASAVKAGIINGRTDTTFDPSATITRAEMATMAARALEKVKGYKDVADVSASLKGFVDASDINSTLQAGVALAADQGIVIGEDGNKFDPNADSTRAQAAVVVYRLINK